MKNEIEKEYKILVTKEQFDRLCSFYKNLKFIRQTNTYFDTKHHSIEKLHGAMRLREKEDISIFTLKMHTDAGLMEHEGVVLDNDNSVFSLPEIQELLMSYHIEGPFFKTTVCITDRAVVRTPYAELCFDRNVFQNGSTDYEIEYEYTQEHNGLAAFQNILSQIQMEYKENCASKIKRALDANT